MTMEILIVKPLNSGTRRTRVLVCNGSYVGNKSIALVKNIWTFTTSFLELQKNAGSYIVKPAYHLPLVPLL